MKKSKSNSFIIISCLLAIIISWLPPNLGNAISNPPVITNKIEPVLPLNIMVDSLKAAICRVDNKQTIISKRTDIIKQIQAQNKALYSEALRLNHQRIKYYKNYQPYNSHINTYTNDTLKIKQNFFELFKHFSTYSLKDTAQLYTEY